MSRLFFRLVEGLRLERHEQARRSVRDRKSCVAAALGRVFEPFFRLESSRNPETGGTGLGLSIARDIAQAHGGSLELRNRQPRGLEAVLTLPRTGASPAHE